MIKRVATRYGDIPQRAELSLVENIDLIFENWKLAVGTATVFFAIGVAYVLIAPPIFQADALIQIEDPNNNTISTPTPWRTREATVPFDAGSTTAAEVELVRSRLVIQQAVRTLHLDIVTEPEYFPIIGKIVARYREDGQLQSPIYGLSSFAWGGEKISISNFDAQYDADYSLRSGDNNTYILNNKHGIPVAQGTVGALTTGSDEGRPVSILVDKLVAFPGTRFNVTKRTEFDAIRRLQESLDIQEKGKDAGILSIALQGTDDQRISAAVNEIARKYVQQNIEHKREEAQTTLAFLDAQLPRMKTQLEDSENAYNVFRNQHGTVDLSEESRLLLGQMVDSQARQRDLEQQRNDLSHRFSLQFPAVAALTQSIEELKEQQLQFAGRVSGLPNTEQNALRLLRDVRVDTELYTNMLNSAQQMDIVRAGQMGNVRVVDWAMASGKPVKPKKMVVSGLALIIGLAVGLGMPFVRRWIKPGIECSDHFEDVLSAPIYSIVPHSAQQAKIEGLIRRGVKGQHLLAIKAPDDIAVEAIRSLQTALHFGSFATTNNIILLTGPRPDVGKSFLAANLATVLASGGKRVLLIDADMRGGDINQYFNRAASPGLSDAIAGHAIAGLIHKGVAGGNLDFLANGSGSSAPAGALMSNQFKTLLDVLSRKYDVILVDAPPLLAVTDAAIIARYAGITLFAVRYGRHTSAEIAEAERRLSNANVTVSGVLVNDVPQRSIKYSAYYSG
ncbi:polysaccharide biosynthesis tyrosine autokinase [Caballeronia sp. LjRoot31]|jgi:tyrosine-protein kinase Etk/Wzc|uniref:polysaccharide biosynthesis tyrosine autokinase n=1 Tax=Caballeronia sp. LjRoot31 TaxID=3342324 RepID=UPI003ECC6F33